MPSTGMTIFVRLTPPSHPPTYSSPPVIIILTIILLVVFFVGFFSLYFCRCVLETLLYTWHFRHSPAGTPVGPVVSNCGQGLEPSIIQGFPTFTYGSVKEYRRERYGLECAICLVEFQPNDMLRLMTACCHVFHQECVDLWLQCHKTCPVCRQSLDAVRKSPEKSPVSMHSSDSAIQGTTTTSTIDETQSLDDTFCIAIKDVNDDRESEGVIGANNNKKKGKSDMFPRSHSTGHSISISSRTNNNNNNKGIEGGDEEEEEEEEDRFTLRLPEHVKAKIIRGHNWTRSCTTFGEYHSKTSTGHGGFGEASGDSTTARDHNNI